MGNGAIELQPEFEEEMDDAAREDFARACLLAGRVHGVSPHYLIAVANHESGGIKNPPPSGPQSSACGPFQITEDTWSTYGPPLGYGPDQRFDPFSQPFVTAKMASDATNELQTVLPNGRFPTGAELYLSHLFGIHGAKTILNADRLDANGTRSEKINVALAAIQNPSVNVDNIMDGNASLLKPGGQPISVDELLDKVADLLQPGLAIAVDLIEKVEPGLYAALPEPGDGAQTPWMATAKEELAKNISEPSQEINKYFTETGLGQGHGGETAWCAAFVSYCIKKSTNKPLHYSARASDWLNIGDASQAAYGAIGVTFPMVSGSSGHVGFVVQFDDKRVMLLAGNQKPAGGGRDAVCVREFAIGKMRGFRTV